MNAARTSLVRSFQSVKMVASSTSYRTLELELHGIVFPSLHPGHHSPQNSHSLSFYFLKNYRSDSFRGAQMHPVFCSPQRSLINPTIPSSYHHPAVCVCLLSHPPCASCSFLLPRVPRQHTNQMAVARREGPHNHKIHSSIPMVMIR